MINNIILLKAHTNTPRLTNTVYNNKTTIISGNAFNETTCTLLLLLFIPLCYSIQFRHFQCINNNIVTINFTRNISRTVQKLNQTIIQFNGSLIKQHLQK